MTDYIKRKTALEDFERCNAENPNWTPQRVKTLLFRQPAADVAEVVHAEIPYDNCPICGATLCSRWHNFCGKCGAKMDGGFDDATS